MCMSCAIKDAGPMEEWPKPTELQWEVSDAIVELYELDSCGAGGPLHIITDDNNVGDGSLDFCQENLAEWDHRHSSQHALEVKLGRTPTLLGEYEIPAAERERVMKLSQAILRGLREMTVAERAVTIELRSFSYPAYEESIPSHWEMWACGKCRKLYDSELLEQAPAPEGGQTVAPWCPNCLEAYGVAQAQRHRR